MSQIEESRQHGDSGRLEVRPPQAATLKIRKYTQSCGATSSNPRARDSEVAPGSLLQKPGDQRHGFCLGEAASCSKAEGR